MAAGGDRDPLRLMLLAPRFREFCAGTGVLWNGLISLRTIRVWLTAQRTAGRSAWSAKIPFSGARQTAMGRSRAYSDRYWGAILAGVTVRRAVIRQSHAEPLPFVSD